MTVPTRKWIVAVIWGISAVITLCILPWHLMWITCEVQWRYYFWLFQPIPPLLSDFCLVQLRVFPFLHCSYHLQECTSHAHFIDRFRSVCVWGLILHELLLQAIYSILLHADCPSNIRFHFIATKGKVMLSCGFHDFLFVARFQFQC